MLDICHPLSVIRMLFEQFGWSIDYDRYADVNGVAMPARLSLRRVGDAGGGASTRRQVRAKVLLTNWDLEAP